MTGIVQTLIGGFGAVAAAVTDAYFNLVTLLLPGNGTNGAQNNTFLDSSTNNFTITRNGNTTQGTFSPFSQTGWSNYFNGSSTISAASNTAFNILAYDTFECWVNFSSLGTNNLIAGRDANYWLAYNHTGIGGTANKIVFAINNGSSWQAVSSNTTPTVGVWYHILGVKDNTTLRIYINGVQENTSTFSGSPANSAGVVYIASNNNAENSTAYISNLRLITGASNAVFPYSGLTTGASFVPQTTPLTAVSGTQLLTCQSNRFVDNSSNAFAITVGGGAPSVQAFSPFAPTAAYDAATNGGSGYFDGTGDYVSAASNAAFNFGTGDFTIEAWAYFNSTADTNSQGVCIVSGTSAAYPVLYISTNGGTTLTFANNSSAIVSGTITKFAWNHIVVTRSGSTVRMFINGTQASSATYTSSVDFNGVYTGVQSSGAGGFMNGYLSGVRLLKGTGYTTFPIPTTPPTNITNTSLLLNFTNAGITDATAKNVLETVGNAQISTTQSKFGGSSMYFDGTGDWLFLNPNAPSPLALGSGDFTVEMWMYPNATYSGAFAGILDSRTSGDGAGLVYFGYTGTANQIGWKDNTTNVVTGTVTQSAWNHVAVVRASGTLKLYINGSLASSGANSTNYTVPFKYIGTSFDPLSFNGYIDDLRITRGYARYSGSTYTQPTAAFPLQ